MNNICQCGYYLDILNNIETGDDYYATNYYRFFTENLFSIFEYGTK